MKLSISNIAWGEKDDAYIYSQLGELGFSGIEVAPTRLIPEAPYNNIAALADYASGLRESYGLEIASLQSIWYKREERLFASRQERQFLLEYTKKAVELACAMNCGNLVFGSPRNRIIPPGGSVKGAEPFFDALGTYAHERGVAISIEAVPEIYGTNCINTTKEALDFVKVLGNPGIKVNLDVGTMISNNESVAIISSGIEHIKHVHISEPLLVLIKKRSIHKEVICALSEAGYSGYVSLEMRCQDNIDDVLKAATYLRELKV